MHQLWGHTCFCTHMVYIHNGSMCARFPYSFVTRTIHPGHRSHTSLAFHFYNIKLVYLSLFLIKVCSHYVIAPKTSFSYNYFFTPLVRSSSSLQPSIFSRFYIIFQTSILSRAIEQIIEQADDSNALAIRLNSNLERNTFPFQNFYFIIFFCYVHFKTFFNTHVGSG